MAVNGGAFDPLDVWFAEKPRASSDQWKVDGSVICKNGERFVDLRDVDRIGLFLWSGKGGTQKRLTLHTSHGSRVIAVRTRLNREEEYGYDALQRTVLIRFGHYRPDAFVDPNDDAGMKFAWLFGALTLGPIGAFLLYRAVGGSLGDGQLVDASPIVEVVMGMLCLAIAGGSVLQLARRPKPSTFYAASPPGGLSRKNDRRDRIVAMCLLVVGIGLLVSRLL